MIKVLSILSLVILISCSGDYSKNESEIKPKIEEVKCVESIIEVVSALPNPINIVDLKNSKWLKTTSGIVTHSESRKLCIPNDSIGFYALYFLIDNAVDLPIGVLKVHTDEDNKAWKFVSANEQFVEIKLSSNKIVLWDSIRVGLSEKRLLSFIGERFHYKKGTVIYSELDSYEGMFTIISDTIMELTVKNRCEK
ncbi:hypothetical protein DNU06_17190 [Putridiphycobacter roseus]|uniref:Uncharacterized protein n=1 Tax=Putridiphycobacter roseus TaxID=2219161 RepID=A0A2W1MWS7_9FLAO|nr:hypothetical protein [Putridiphycobacter roseus]PZE15610.1 hypothetical protein DNU06_17190 [Putridiphycobacter roseus]